MTNDLPVRNVLNARLYEHWQTDGKHGIYNRPDMNAQQPYMDTYSVNTRGPQPLPSYSGMPRFQEGGHRFEQNPYFDKYDPSYDGQNAIRELRNTVYENPSGGVEWTAETKAAGGRMFSIPWIKPCPPLTKGK